MLSIMSHTLRIAWFLSDRVSRVSRFSREIRRFSKPVTIRIAIEASTRYVRAGIRGSTSGWRVARHNDGTKIAMLLKRGSSDADLFRVTPHELLELVTSVLITIDIENIFRRTYLIVPVEKKKEKRRMKKIYIYTLFNVIILWISDIWAVF